MIFAWEFTEDLLKPLGKFGGFFMLILGIMWIIYAVYETSRRESFKKRKVEDWNFDITKFLKALTYVGFIVGLLCLICGASGLLFDIPPSVAYETTTESGRNLFTSILLIVFGILTFVKPANDLPLASLIGVLAASAVVVTKDPEYGQNLDFHRAMQYTKNRMSTRIIKGRDFYKFLDRTGELDAVYCVGNTPNILVAAATSVKTGINELEIANALATTQVTKAKTVEVLIPAGCEVVLEGRVFMKDRADEGPFIDLTETYDVIREEPVFEVKKITHRKDPIWQALIPGALEHKVLMGMPREPTIFKTVNEAGVKCIDVNVNPGGSSWLHAIVKIDKKEEDDGKKAIHAAFQGHRSCKHVFVVDKDINIYDPLEVEWSMATRFQAERDLVDIGKEPGSSLDPSAEPGTKLTNKIGFDFTAPLKTKGKSFARAEFPQVDLRDYTEV